MGQEGLDQSTSPQRGGSTGQAVLVRKGEWVQYSSPHLGGAEYVAVCLPAFSVGTVHRDR